MTDPLMAVEGLVKRFYLKGQNYVGAINGISFEIGRGETLGLVGESGSGKTTVGRCLLRLVEPTSGRIRFEGSDITRLTKRELKPLRSRLQMVFQDPFASLNPRRTVRQTVEEPLALQRDAPAHAWLGMITEMLKRVGLGPQYLDRFPIELTASEQQRVGIARALITSPKLVVLDEPTSTLDPTVREEILGLLRSLQSSMSVAYLFISHDIMAVERMSHRVAVMYLGHIVEQAPTAAIMADPRHPYTRALMSAVLSPDPTRRLQRSLVVGEIPSAINPRRECPFYSRCPIRLDRCLDDIPPMAAVGPEHGAACLRWRDTSEVIAEVAPE
ncbi:ABC transporter ATP-binding protein [Bradyrhizobium sp. 170]|uniref:ABC transporter ATP-binding protein n=1 Tax=Bradyrhizobium sp. 170 TaxID=2782641 RepID=UPI0020004A23|nr:ABC transporter ATP-binding protein [Bradyrhizobium sp. 170]UPK07048.1 ABC transporter ATP-binding protein [Bradyrhizobium sp. 170]